MLTLPVLVVVDALAMVFAEPQVVVLAMSLGQGVIAASSWELVLMKRLAKV